MAVRYLQTGDELPLHSATTFDDNSAEGWWGGVYLSAVSVATAAALAVNASQTIQSQVQWTWDIQDPGNLHGQFDEDFWVNPTPPVPLSFLVPDQWRADEQTSILFGQPDEDFWQNPVAPVPLTFLVPQQWISDEQSPVLFGNPFEDDSWQLSVPSTSIYWQPQPYWFDDQLAVAQTILTIVDEDFWTPQIPQQPWMGLPIQAFVNDEVIVPQPVAFQPDEDFWFNQTAPQFLPFLTPMQWGFETDASLTPVVVQSGTIDPEIHLFKLERQLRSLNKL